MPRTTGANYTGSTLETFIHNRLEEKQYQFVSKDKFKAAIYLEQPIYSRQFHIGNGH